MFNDVDETLRNLLVADVPLDPAEVDISFERPVREWSSRVARPTLNLFLYDIRERVDFRDDSWRTTRLANGQVTKERLARRVDLSYMVTAWAREPADEHRILGATLACMYRNAKVGEQYLEGYLRDTTAALLLRAMPADHQVKPSDIWGVLDNEIRTSLTWVATAPLDVFAPITGPMVVTRDLRVRGMEGQSEHRSLQVAGIARRRGTEETVPGVRITVLNTGLLAESDAEGKFSLREFQPGTYRWRIEPPRGRARELDVTVPAASYDLEV